LKLPFLHSLACSCGTGRIGARRTASDGVDYYCGMRTRLAASAIGLCLIATTHVDAGAVTGIVRTVAREGVPPALAIVYAEPIDTAGPRMPRRVTLGQKNKTFQPRVLAVPAGSTVEFPNNDLIFHNVFSLSGPQPFDLGLYRAGESRARMFTDPGTYRIFCNIHPQMTAVIVVTPSGLTTLASQDGRFTLDLPPGRYRLTAVSERASPVSAEITSTEGVSTAPELTLDESAWMFTRHKNKFGKEYPPDAYRR
jgi:plastocyanin